MQAMINMYLPLLVHLLALNIFKYCEASMFHVERSGIIPVEEDDVGIRFYLTIANNVASPISVVKEKEPECCWEVDYDDKDCESMQLFGGFPTDIARASTKNVSYTFPNMYPLDRVGFCKFFLKLRGEDNGMMHKVEFDTTLKDSSSYFKSILGSEVKVYRQCKGVDQDIRNDCQAVNCAKKYNGFRSFYRKDTGKCEAAAHCRTLLDHTHLPTSAFDFENNQCKSLIARNLEDKDKEAINSFVDASDLAQQKFYEDIDPSTLLLNCNHGRQQGSYCRCDRGWKTVSALSDTGAIKMLWCSKQVTVKPLPQKPYKNVKVVVLIILITTCLLLFAFVIFLWMRLFFWEVIIGETTKAEEDDDEALGDRVNLDPEGMPPFPPLPEIDFTIDMDDISSEDIENSDIWDFTDNDSISSSKVKPRAKYVRKHSGGKSLLTGDGDVNLGRVNLADTDVTVTKSGTFVLVEKEKEEEQIVVGDK